MLRRFEYRKYWWEQHCHGIYRGFRQANHEKTTLCPQGLLKNFSVSNQKSEQVYVVFANDENAKMVSIDNICCRSYLYDQIAIDPDSKTHVFAAPNEIENSFIELEGEYATIISKKKMLYEIQMNLSWRGWKLIN